MISKHLLGSDTPPIWLESKASTDQMWVWRNFYNRACSNVQERGFRFSTIQQLS